MPSWGYARHLNWGRCSLSIFFGSRETKKCKIFQRKVELFFSALSCKTLYGLYLYYTAAMFWHFKLTLPETVSVLTCVITLPNSGVFFAVAAKTLMSFYTRETINIHGFDFGYLLERCQKEIYWHFLNKTQVRSTHWQRFSDQRPTATKFTKIPRKKWHRQCKMMLKIYLRLWNHFSNEPNAGQRLPTYFASLTNFKGRLQCWSPNYHSCILYCRTHWCCSILDCQSSKA